MEFLKRLLFIIVYLLWFPVVAFSAFPMILIGFPALVIIWMFTGKFYADELINLWCNYILAIPYKVAGINV